MKSSERRQRKNYSSRYTRRSLWNNRYATRIIPNMDNILLAKGTVEVCPCDRTERHYALGKIILLSFGFLGLGL